MPSIKEQALAWGLDPQLVYSRMARGKTLAEALAWEAPKSIAAEARARGLSVGMVHQRMASGKPLIEALTLPPRRNVKELINSRCPTCREPFFVKSATLKTRQKNKCGLMFCSKKCAAKWHQKDSLGAKAQARGLSPHAVRSRIERGWSVEMALSIPSLQPSNSRRAAALARGLSPGTVKWRIRRGWSIEEALATPVRPTEPPSPVIQAARIRARINREISKNLMAELAAMGLAFGPDDKPADVYRMARLMKAIPDMRRRSKACLSDETVAALRHEYSAATKDPAFSEWPSRGPYSFLSVLAKREGVKRQTIANILHGYGYSGIGPVTLSPWGKQPLVELRCPTCGRTFSLKPCVVRKRKGKSTTGRICCSRKCQGKYIPQIRLLPPLDAIPIGCWAERHPLGGTWRIGCPPRFSASYVRRLKVHYEFASRRRKQHEAKTEAGREDAASP